jgi:phosphatidylinositol-3-phosphatase
MLAATACGGQATRASQTPAAATSPAASSTPSVEPSPGTNPPAHVFVIVMENRSADQAIKGGYTSQLAARYSYTSNYHGVSHPSLPNYLAMTSGSTWGISDDGFHKLPAGGLGAQLTAAGVSWRAYMEGMNNGCLNSGYPYALKHNPFAYYGAGCGPQVVPFTSFASDMSGAVPSFVWITPDLCHDGHDCSTAAADGWLARTVPVILVTDAWKQGGVLFITWDEGEDSANSVLTVVIRPHPQAHVSRRLYNHYSLLATMEDELGVARLGAAARAQPMTDLMTTS